MTHPCLGDIREYPLYVIVLHHKCAAFFDQFFSWSFWSSSTLPRLVVLHCIVLRFVACFFDQFFSWSFWLSSSLPRLVVLRCIVLHFVVCLVLHRLVFCCDLSLICLSSFLAKNFSVFPYLHCTTRCNF